jgi:hypothetical protein
MKLRVAILAVSAAALALTATLAPAAAGDPIQGTAIGLEGDHPGSETKMKKPQGTTGTTVKSGKPTPPSIEPGQHGYGPRWGRS